MAILNHDILVVGGGLAGLRAAIEAHLSANVAVLTKVYPIRSHSVAAQGGVNAALGNNMAKGPDSWEAHAFDTVKGSDYLADQDSVEIMCQEGIRRVIELEHWGAPFSRDENGLIAQRPFGGAGFPRTCYAADRTGHVMLHTLFEQTVKRSIKMYNEWHAIALIVREGRCLGVVALDFVTGEVHAIGAKAVILATGGYGRLYSKSTNALINTGSALAIAYRAGVPAQDLEFVQFHPTTLFGTNILITEGARGEGGILLNNKLERFMSRYAPHAMDLAPRDIVARSMWTEIIEGRGYEGGYLLLDLRHLGAKKIMERLPGIRQIAMDFAGIDPIEEPLPVLPGQHYSMGGIRTDSDGVTEMEGLYAAGECACVSVHGANRLGGNSLLETIVFGQRAGEHAARKVGKRPAPPPEPLKEALAIQSEKLGAWVCPGEGERPSDIRDALTHLMMEKVGIFRHEAQLKEALAEIKDLRARFGKVTVRTKSLRLNQELITAIDVQAMLDLAELVTLGALARTESRGSHFRTDFKERDDASWMKHTVARITDAGPQLSYEPVRVTKYEPKKREY